MSGSPVDRLAERLARAAPSLRQVLAEHREAHGEQASRAFLRTVAHVTTGRYLSGVPAAVEELRSVLELLEGELGADAEVDRLVAGSFLAHLPTPGDPRAVALELLGPRLRSELERQRAGGGIPVSSPTREAMERVVEANPELRSVLREHLDFAEEMLPHLLIGDVLRTTVGWHVAGRKATVAGILAALEAEYGVDYEVDELIAVSFVEDLPYSDEPGHGLVDELGPGLRAEYERQRHGRDGAY